MFPANPIVKPCIGCFGCWINKLKVLFYGECDVEERHIAESLVRANAMNFDAKSCEVRFFDVIEELRSEIL